MTEKPSNQISVDNFRFIVNLQTTARQLSVVTEIVKQLNNKQLPKRFLEEMLIKWSQNEELTNAQYARSKGKITNNGKKTAALRYYYGLAYSLGLTQGFNNVYIDTNISYILLYFLNCQDDNAPNQPISFQEKIFYFFQLLQVDADGIMLCLDQLRNEAVKTQSDLQKSFKSALNIRLEVKSELIASTYRHLITNKLRAVNYVWRSPEVYAEHIIAPRYEWLSTLGFVDILRTKGATKYCLSPIGSILMNLLPKIEDTNSVTDISEEWMETWFFSVIGKVFPVKGIKYFVELQNEFQRELVAESFEKAIKNVKSSVKFRLPLKSTYLFVCMDLLFNKNIIINFSEIKNLLSTSLIFNNKTYNQKISGRASESYITITANK
jgi:hypothetical protein